MLILVAVLQDDGAQCGVGQHLFADEGREFRSQQGQRPRNSLTPELAFEDHLSEQHADGSHATRKLFPIFRPLAQRKVKPQHSILKAPICTITLTLLMLEKMHLGVNRAPLCCRCCTSYGMVSLSTMLQRG